MGVYDLILDPALMTQFKCGSFILSTQEIKGQCCITEAVILILVGDVMTHFKHEQQENATQGQTQ